MKNNQLDNIDRRILRALQQNARLANNELAQQIGLSCSACLRRVSILEENGIIERYAAICNAEKLHYPLMIYVFGSFLEQDYKMRERFIFEMKLLPQVSACHLLSGDWDFILKMHVQNLHEFHQIQKNYLNKEIGIEKIKSNIIVKTIKDTTELPL